MQQQHKHAVPRRRKQVLDYLNHTVPLSPINRGDEIFTTMSDFNGGVKWRNPF